MDSLSTAYEFAMHNGATKDEETTGSPVLRPTQRVSLCSVVALLDGLDVVAAVYEPRQS